MARIAPKTLPIGLNLVRINPETVDQIKIVNWVRQCTNLPCIHIPNEGKRSTQQGSILKKMGLTAGVADLFFPRANHNSHGLWIEVKTLKGKPTEAQTLFINQMLDEGYEAKICYGFEDAIRTIKMHFNISDSYCRKESDPPPPTHLIPES